MTIDEYIAALNNTCIMCKSNLVIEKCITYKRLFCLNQSSHFSLKFFTEDKPEEADFDIHIDGITYEIAIDNGKWLYINEINFDKTIINYKGNISIMYVINKLLSNKRKFIEMINLLK